MEDQRKNRQQLLAELLESRQCRVALEAELQKATEAVRFMQFAVQQLEEDVEKLTGGVADPRQRRLLSIRRALRLGRLPH